MGLCCLISALSPFLTLAVGGGIVWASCWILQTFVLTNKGHRPRVLRDLRDLHVVITGGSKGIGRALAVEALHQGASVLTIVARDHKFLEEARLELRKLLPSPTPTQPQQLIQIVSLDITSDYSAIAKALATAAETANQPIDILINNAGGSIDGEFEHLPIEAFEKQIRLNYLSAVYVTRAVVESMKSRPDAHCRIVFVSSQAGQVGVYGYSAYAPAKFALRGLAETLRMELKPFNIWITIAFPPNTRTEGFVEELIHMPEATRRISGDENVMEASDVAKQIWIDVRHGRYYSTMGSDGWMLGLLTVGMTPVQNGLSTELMQQVFLSGILRLVALFYTRKFDGIALECRRREIDSHKEHEEN